MRARRVGLAPMKDRHRTVCRCGVAIEFIREPCAPDGHWVHLAGGELCFDGELDVAEPNDA